MKVNNAIWLGFISILLGCVCIHFFFWQLGLGYFATNTFAEHIHHLATHNQASFIWNYLANYISHHANVFAPLFASLFFLAGILLLLRVLVPAAAFIMFLLFLFYGSSGVGVAGHWTFEYLLPCIFALILTLATFKDFKYLDVTWRQYLLGFTQDVNVKLGYWIIIVAIVCLILFCLFYLYKNGGEQAFSISLLSIITIFTLSIISRWLDRFRALQKKQACFISVEFWLNIFTFVAGVMLLFQVIDDQMLGWYSIKGYSAVIHTYYTYDNAPTFFKDFLRWSEQYANILLPIQFTFELIASISLITLLFRFPLTLLAALFFSILSFSELGVPATWPATAQSPLTWIWELWLTTFIILITGSYYTIKTFKALSWRNIIFGNKIFRPMQRFNQSFFLLVFIIIEIILFIEIPYPTMRYMRALYFTLLLAIPLFCIMIFLDQFRIDNSSVSRCS